MTAPFDIAVPDLGGRPLCAETLPDLWFPDAGGEGAADAKRICRRCPVIDACLAWAITNDERFGIWAGLTQTELRRLRRRTRRGAAA